MKHPRVLLGFLILIASSRAFAGAWSSGGGNAVVCKTPAGAITSAELLDLYEGRMIRGLDYPPAAGLPGEQAVSAAAHLSSIAFSGEQIVQEVKFTESRIRFLRVGIGLQPVDDSGTIVVPAENCRIVQAARYEPSDEIFVNSDVWKAMDSKSQAALLVHEALYKRMRFYGETNSKRVRIAVANAFSRQTLIPFDFGLPRNLEICSSRNSDAHLPKALFYTYPRSDGKGVVIQFLLFNGQPMLSKSTVSLFNATWPLRKSTIDAFWFTRMESQVDQDTGVYIRTTPRKSGRTGFISEMNGQTGPHIPFNCKAVSGIK